MLAPPPRKRHRSTSPPPEPDQSSPLDTFLKRRRRIDTFGQVPIPTPLPIENEAGPSTGTGTIPYTRFVEKRRTRQWEKQNAPLPLSTQSQVQSSAGSDSASFTQFTDVHTPHSYSQPNTYDDYTSPVHLRPYSTSQPLPRNHQMSSSPIRHQPPSSSPFRDKEMASVGDSAGRNGTSELTSSTNTKVEPGRHGNVDEDGDAGMMDEDEMRREWGEEYTAQNTVLHNLHLARSRDRTTHPLPLIHTPSCPRHAYGVSQLDGYRSPNYTPPSSSPVRRSIVNIAPHDGDPDMDTDMDYETEDLGALRERVIRGDVDLEVDGRYEEVNRILRELAVVRRERWGEN